MCNGANLAYEKKAFNEVSGFEGIDHIASGDDMLLMHKIRKKYPDRFNYLKSKESYCLYAANENLERVFKPAYPLGQQSKIIIMIKESFWVLLLVYLFNFSFLVLLIAGFWLPSMVISPCFVDRENNYEFPFVYSVAAFFNKPIIY